MQEEQGVQKKVGTFDRNQIDFYWKDIVPLLENVVGFSEFYTIASVYELLQSGDWQLWALSDSMIQGVVITTIRVFPKVKVFQILVAAGNFLQFFDEIEAMFEWLARDSGCTFIQGQVRSGVARKLKRSRGDLRQVIITRRVVEGTQ